MKPLYRFKLNVRSVSKKPNAKEGNYNTECMAETEKDAIKVVALIADSFKLKLLRVNWCKNMGEV